MTSNKLKLVLLILLFQYFSCEQVKNETFSSQVNSRIGGDGKGNYQKDIPQDEYIFGNPCEDETPWGCDPITSKGCDASTCDYDETDAGGGFFCFQGFSKENFDSCDATSGPWCNRGLTCYNGKCSKFCCGDTDCLTGTCNSVDWKYVIGHQFGVCTLNDLDAGLDSGPGAS